MIFIHINKTGGSSVTAALGLPFEHKTALEVIKEIGQKAWNEQFSFSFVRNPWEKVLSQYYNKFKSTGSFPEWVIKNYKNINESNKFFSPQINWLVDSNWKILVNYVGRFEKLSDDFNYICDHLKIKAVLPHLKKSNHDEYKKYYTEETKNIIACHFHKDIEYFGYTF